MRDFLFWDLMYLYPEFICCRRCFFDNWCICTALIFIVADALLGINTSATCFSSNLQILLNLLIMYNCIYILLFLGFKDTSFANFASTSHVFDNVWMLLIKILHLQPTLSIPCRYSPVKLCICILLFQCFAGTPHQNFASSIPQNPLSQISPQISFAFYLLYGLSRHLTYKKIDIRNSCEYGTSVGDT